MKNLVKLCANVNCRQHAATSAKSCPNCGSVSFVRPLTRSMPETNDEHILKTMFAACGHKIKFIDCTPKKSVAMPKRTKPPEWHKVLTRLEDL
jgi:hypothetical protein